MLCYFFRRYLTSSNNPDIFSNEICLGLKIKRFEHGVLFGKWWSLSEQDLDGLVSWERKVLEMRGGKEEKMAD